MTADYYYQIDRNIKANKLYRFEAELKESKDEARIETLNKLIKELHEHKDNKQIKDDKMKAHFNLLKTTPYQKKWQFLNVEQKLNRLDEFVERNGLDEKQNQNISKIRESINDGSLANKCITYDKIKCQIEKVDTLVENNKVISDENSDDNDDSDLDTKTNEHDKLKKVNKTFRSHQVL